MDSEPEEPVVTNEVIIGDDNDLTSQTSDEEEDDGVILKDSEEVGEDKGKEAEDARVERERRLREERELQALKHTGLSQQERGRSPSLVRRRKYEAASSVSKKHALRIERSMEDEVLGESDETYEAWLAEKPGLNEDERAQLVQVHRLIGPITEAGSLRSNDDFMAPVLQELYNPDWAKPDEHTLPIQGIFELTTNRNERKVALTLFARPVPVKQKGKKAKGRGSGFADRERNHVMDAKHPKLADGENAVNGLPCTHQPVFVNLDFLEEHEWTDLLVEGRTNEEKISFPHGMCMVPRLARPLGTKLRPKDKMRIVFRNVFLTEDFLAQLSTCSNLVELTFERCGMLSSGRLGDLQWLKKFNDSSFMLDRRARFFLDKNTLPSLTELEVDKRHRFIHKSYYTVRGDQGLGKPPTLRADYNSLRQVQLLPEDEEPTADDRSALKILSLKANFKDLYLLSGRPEGDVNDWLACFSPKVLKLSTTLLEEDPAMMFMEEKVFDVNLSPYNLSLAEQLLTHKFATSAGDGVMLMNSQLEGMRYKSNTILPLDVAYRLWTKILSTQPRVFSANCYFFVSMGIVPPYRNFPMPIAENDGDEPEGRTSEHMRSKANSEHCEKMLRDNYSLIMQKASFTGKPSKLVVSASNMLRRVFLVMGSGNGNRIPIIVMQVTPFMDANLWIPQPDICTMYVAKFPERDLEARLGHQSYPWLDHALPAGQKSRTRTNLKLEYLVTDLDIRMPYSSRDIDPAIGFPMTYLVFWAPMNSGSYPDNFKVVTNTADVQDITARMKKAAEQMELPELQTRLGDDAGMCGISVSLNPLDWVRKPKKLK